eukprot:gene17840-24224_t
MKDIAEAESEDVAEKETVEDAGLVVRHPRSQALREVLPDPDRNFKLLAQSSTSGMELLTFAQRCALCKIQVEVDRNEAAREDGYCTGLHRTYNAGAMAKGDLLVGIPADRPEWEVFQPLLHAPTQARDCL